MELAAFLEGDDRKYNKSFFNVWSDNKCYQCCEILKYKTELDKSSMPIKGIFPSVEHINTMEIYLKLIKYS